MEKWIQTNDLKVKRGNVTLDIGDYIDYTDCTGKNGESLYKGRWQVLGATEEGNLLIISEKNVTTHYFNKEHTHKGGMEAYSKGVEILDELCKVYASGNGAINSRSIRIEDIDSLTNFDKATYLDYGKKNIYHNKKNKTFRWHDGERWNCTNLEQDIAFINTYYWYTTNNKSKIYNMLFGKSDEKDYWLASLFVATDNRYVNFGLRLIESGYVGGDFFIDSYGDYGNSKRGVRAVVTLKSDVQCV